MFLCRTSKVSLLLFFLLLLLLLCFLSFLYFCLVLNHKFIYVNVCTEFMRANTLSTRIEFYVIYTATIQKYRRHTHTTGTFCSHTHTLSVSPMWLQKAFTLAQWFRYILFAVGNRRSDCFVVYIHIYFFPFYAVRIGTTY